ncbi:MAG: glucokinase [Myxococcales bacterium]
MDHLLAGDIGGTKTALSLYARDPQSGYRDVAHARYVSAEYSGLAPIIRDFLQAALGAGAHDSVRAAAFGVAGPVENGVCKTTNLPWIIEQRLLSQILGAPVGLINDFHAVALGIGELMPEDFEVLQVGQRDPEGPAAILGAGTGLGEAILLPGPGGGVQVIASEGGHVDFAPRNQLELELLQFLWSRHRRVSVERVVSGPGIKTLYDFVIESQQAPESGQVREALEKEDPSKVIGEHGVAGTDAACEKAVDLFVSLYGSEAGNLALKILPRGGLFVAGGVAPKLIAKIRDGSFMHALLDKGRLSSALMQLHVAVVMNPHVGLFGARRLAKDLHNSRI